jgi:hypothetical protein
VQRTSDITDGGWLGQPVIDENSKPIGKVVDVLYDDDTSNTPTWAIVGVGPLKKAHFVPLADAYRTGDGRLVLPYDQRIVKGAPRADKSHVMTREIRQATIGHYGMT